MAEEMKERPRFYRSRSDRYLGGVCGGIAAYFQIDSNMARLLFVIASFFWGTGLIIYLAALVLVPENPDESAEPGERTIDNTLFIGIIFIFFGVLLLSWQFDLFRFFSVLDLPWTTIWAIFLISIGGLILFAQWQQQTNAETGGAESGRESGEQDKSGLRGLDIHRSRSDRKIGGICGGLANHFNIDSSIVRLGWVLLTVLSKGLGVLIYIALMFVLPEESGEQVV